MFCIPVDIPPELCLIDDERKAIYHSKEQRVHLGFCQ